MNKKSHSILSLSFLVVMPILAAAVFLTSPNAANASYPTSSNCLALVNKSNPSSAARAKWQPCYNNMPANVPIIKNGASYTKRAVAPRPYFGVNKTTLPLSRVIRSRPSISPMFFSIRTKSVKTAPIIRRTSSLNIFGGSNRSKPAIFVNKKLPTKTINYGDLPFGVPEWAVGLVSSYSWNKKEALKIMRCESRFKPNVINALYPDYSIGLFQINIHGYLAAMRPSERWLINKENNVKYAYLLYKNHGWDPWRNCANKYNLL